MTKAQAESVFEAFHPSTADASREVVGHGVGLSICRKICKQLNGDISVESSTNNGCTFFFTMRVEPTKSCLSKE